MKLPTKFSQFIYDWCPLPKYKLSMNIFNDIVDAFLINHPGVILIRLIVDEVNMCVLAMPPELDTLQLRADWHNAFYVHGYNTPVLDIEWIEE